MTAAFALLSLLAISLTVVRIGGTALRLTGMSMHAARFQAISALTGTGFTTQEAETTMHHPVRRRILIMLMFTGHLGVVSLASTVILGVSAASVGSVWLTVLYMVLALAVICALASSSMLDRLMCAAVGQVLIRLGWFEMEKGEILLELPNGDQVVEHEVQETASLAALIKEHGGINVLSLNGQSFASVSNSEAENLASGDRLVCLAPSKTQLDLSRSLGNL